MLKAFESEGMVRRKGTPAALREESWCDDDRGLCADSVVTHDIPPDSVAVGIPPRAIKGPSGPKD